MKNGAAISLHPLLTFSVELTFSCFFSLEGRGLHTLDDNHLIYTLQIFSPSLFLGFYFCLQWSFPYRSPHREPCSQWHCLTGSRRNSLPLTSGSLCTCLASPNCSGGPSGRLLSIYWKSESKANFLKLVSQGSLSSRPTRPRL